MPGIRVALAVAGCAAAAFWGGMQISVALAQTMYRCGSVYQDRPCDGDQPGKSVGAARSTQAPARTGTDPECARRGEESLKIIWAREAGATEERQLAETNSASRKQLVSDVYRHRGSAPDIRAAIERECVAERERNARSGNTPRQTAGNDPRPTAPDPSERARVEERQAENERKRQLICERHKREEAGIREKQRAGGGGATMDGLNRRLREIQASKQAANCPLM